MNNQQNEQAQVQTNQSTQAKTKKQYKPLFQEGTFLYKITYGFTAKVKNGEISFAKVFWVGLILKFIIAYILIEIGSRTLANLEMLYIFYWMKYMWHSRKTVYHPAWFYIGFGLVLFPILWFAIGFVKGFIPAFLAARRGY